MHVRCHQPNQENYNAFDGSRELYADSSTTFQRPLGEGGYSARPTGILVGTGGRIYTFTLAAVPNPASLIMFSSSVAGEFGSGRHSLNRYASRAQ